MIENYGRIEFEFWTSSKVAATVTINPQDNYGWSVQDMSNLIALLELQRSMLADEKLNVSVTVASPIAKNRSDPIEKSSADMMAKQEIASLIAKTT